MSDTPKILRPGSSISYAARIPNKSPRFLSGAHTSLGQNIRQIFPSPRDSSALTNFKSAYQTLMNCVASFLSHNNTTTEFREVFNKIIKTMDENMNKFILATPKYPSESNDKKNEKYFLKRFLPFLHQFWTFSKYIKQIKEAGDNPIHEAIDMHFQIITDGLNSVRQSSTSVTGMHDPIVRRAKALQSQMMNLKRVSINVIQESKDSTKITTEIRAFSRLLNTAFSTEFSASPLGPTNLEKLRSECYTSCCSIIHSIREAKLFKEHSAAMIVSYDNFKEAIETLLEKNGVTQRIGELCGEEEEEEDVVYRFDRNLTLQELIEKGREAFPDPKMHDYFELLEIASNNALSQIETLNGKIEEFKNIKKEKKQAEIERDAAKKFQDELQKENEELKILMDENNKKMAEYDKNAGRDTQYKKAVVEVLPLIASYLNEEIRTPTLDKSIISYFKNLMNNMFSQKCQRCVQFLKRESQIQDMIGEYIEAKPDVIETVQEVISQLNENKRAVKTKTQELITLNQQLGSMREGYSKILSMFTVTQNKTVDIGEFTYQTIKDELDRIKEETNNLLNQKTTAQQEFVADLMKRLKQILGTEETTSIEDYLFRIETKMSESTQKEINNNLFINRVSNKLHTMMKMQKNNGIPLEEGLLKVLDLLSERIQKLEEGQKPANNEEAKIEVKADYSRIGEKLNKLLQSNEKIETENDVLTKIDNISNMIYDMKKKHDNSALESENLRKCIKSVANSISQYLNNEEIKLMNEGNELIDTALRLAKELSKKKVTITIDDINKLFKPIIETLKVTSKDDPFTYIPEFVDEYNMMLNSITELKPFATVLNNIFTNFDCQFSNFDPQSQKYQYFKSQVLQMHDSLNQMSAAKTHNLIFLILSRFVTLISSIMSGLAVAFTGKQQ